MADTAKDEAPKVGDTVRIVEDEYPQLVGLVGTVTQIGSDGTTAWVQFHPSQGAWCPVANLSVIPPEEKTNDE